MTDYHELADCLTDESSCASLSPLVAKSLQLIADSLPFFEINSLAAGGRIIVCACDFDDLWSRRYEEQAECAIVIDEKCFNECEQKCIQYIVGKILAKFAVDKDQWLYWMECCGYLGVKTMSWHSREARIASWQEPGSKPL